MRLDACGRRAGVMLYRWGVTAYAGPLWLVLSNTRQLWSERQPGAHSWARWGVKLSVACRPRPATPIPSVMVIDLAGCARCHADGHAALAFQPLRHPVYIVPGPPLTHWAECPETGEPILMRWSCEDAPHGCDHAGAA